MAHLFTGLVLAGLGVWGIVAWWEIFGLVMRGCVPFTLLVLGLVAIITGVRRGSIANGAPIPYAQPTGEPPASAPTAQNGSAG